MILTKKQYIDNLEKIEILFERCFGKRLNKEFFYWRYLDNPLNELFVAVEFDGDNIVSHYSVSPVMMSIMGLKKKAALSMTTMTDPSFAGKGLFPKLAEEVYEQLYVNEYNFVWGFPNSQSHRGIIKRLMWLDIYEIPTMVLDVSNLILNGKKILNANITMDNDFELNYACFENSKEFISVSKSNQYLKWRYANNPLNEYSNFVIGEKKRVRSYCIIKNYQDSIDMVDFQTTRYEDAWELMQNILLIAIKEGKKFINFWAPRHNVIHSICEKIGFINREPITYFGYRCFSNNKKIYKNYSNWHIQMGDSDVY